MNGAPTSGSVYQTVEPRVLWRGCPRFCGGLQAFCALAERRAAARKGCPTSSDPQAARHPTIVLMAPLTLAQGAAAFGAAFLAGAINSVAGGGTLVSFPTLIWLGLDSVTANATSTVAIWPGTLGGILGYRREIRAAEPSHLALLAPSLIGGIAGAILLRMTPSSVFDRVVPFLILFATVLFMAQARVQRMLGTAKVEGHRTGKWLVGAMFFQLAVGLYGGYFGAGIGILMLAALSILGLKDIHEMNALKVVLAGAD